MISELGLNIRKFREVRKISAYELAKRANVGSSTISQIETGKRKTLKGDTLSKIAAALNVSVNDLIGNSDKINVKPKDIMELLSIIKYSDFIELDGIKLNDNEKGTIETAFIMGIHSIKYKRL